jgi:hypothetical protein
MAASWGPNVLSCMPIRDQVYPSGFAQGMDEQRAAALFSKHDADHDGFLNRRQMLQFFKEAGRNYPQVRPPGCPAGLPARLSVGASVCLSVHLCLSVGLPACLSDSPSTCHSRFSSCLLGCMVPCVRMAATLALPNTRHVKLWLLIPHPLHPCSAAV